MATALLVAGPTLTFWIPGQTLFASTTSYSSLVQRLRHVLISAEADKGNPQEWRVVDSVTTNDSTKWNGRVKYHHKIHNHIIERHYNNTVNFVVNKST